MKLIFKIQLILLIGIINIPVLICLLPMIIAKPFEWIHKHTLKFGDKCISKLSKRYNLKYVYDNKLKKNIWKEVL